MNFIGVKSMKVMSVKCPVCNKRAFDIKKSKGEMVEIQLKCPHCHKIINVPVREII